MIYIVGKLWISAFSWYFWKNIFFILVVVRILVTLWESFHHTTSHSVLCTFFKGEKSETANLFYFLGVCSLSTDERISPSRVMQYRGVAWNAGSLLCQNFKVTSVHKQLQIFWSVLWIIKHLNFEQMSANLSNLFRSYWCRVLNIFFTNLQILYLNGFQIHQISSHIWRRRVL